MNFDLERHVSSNLVYTLSAFVILLVIRWISLRKVLKVKFPNSQIKKQWIRQIKTVFLILFILCIVGIWAKQIQALAISLVAVAAALVIATKELILCVLGGILKSSTRPFEMGDRIEIGELRGDVVDTSVFTTSLYEIGPGKRMHQYTGRVIEIPNSRFLSEPIINETSKQKYVLHTFSVPMKLQDNWELASEILLDASSSVASEYIEKAAHNFEIMGRTKGIEAPSTEPRVSVYFPDAEKIDLVVRMPAPSYRKGRVEQEVLKIFLKKWKEV